MGLGSSKCTANLTRLTKPRGLSIFISAGPFAGGQKHFIKNRTARDGENSIENINSKLPERGAKKRNQNLTRHKILKAGHSLARTGI